jgi:hypothetical protein
MKKAMRDIIKNLKRENSDVRKTIRAMLDRGLDPKWVDEEIGRALLGCLREVQHGDPDRFPQVLIALAEGTPTETLFTDAWYKARPSASN